MKAFKTFKEFVFESSLFESDSKKTSKIHPELDMPQRHDWFEKIIYREWNKENDNELTKAEESDDENKVSEIKERIKKDPKFGPEYKKYLDDNEAFEKLAKEAGAEDGDASMLSKKQIDSFAKKNPKGFAKLIDLQANRNVHLTEKPGGILQLTTQDMEGGELQAEAIRQKMTAYINKNGKPKGMIIDNRSNTGGMKNPSEAIADFFAKDDKYTIEAEQFNYGPRRYKTLDDYMKCYEDADGNKTPWDPEVGDYVNSLKTEKEKQDFWEKSVKSGKFELPNERQNMVPKKDRLTDIPVVLQTSIRTFSSGEYCSETLKNINPNVMHIGTNSGGGGNRTALGTDQKDWNNFDKSRVEQAELTAKSFAESYAEADQGKEVEEQIKKWIKEEGAEKINKMSGKDLAKTLKEKIKSITNDDHVEINFLDKPEGEGKDTQHGMQILVPQVGAARALRDPKTKELIKDSAGNIQFKGAWEKKGTMQSGTSASIETDPNTATRDALEYLYKKTGQESLAKKLNENPEEFGLTKEGKDGIFDDKMPSKQSAFVNGGAQRQIDQHKKSMETLAANKKNGVNAVEQMEKAEKDFKGDAGKEEIKNIKDTGATKMFAGIKNEIAQKLKDMKVMVAMPGGKKKTIQTETLMDFVPIDPNDPEEQAMIKAQAMQYARINALRVKMKKKELVAFEQWLKRNIELAKDNKDYQARVKAKTLGKMKKPAVKENFVYSFDHYLVEEENDRVFESIVNENI